MMKDNNVQPVIRKRGMTTIIEKFQNQKNNVKIIIKKLTIKQQTRAGMREVFGSLKKRER
jgi:hypothetical protein